MSFVIYKMLYILITFGWLKTNMILIVNENINCQWSDALPKFKGQCWLSQGTWLQNGTRCAEEVCDWGWI